MCHCTRFCEQSKRFNKKVANIPAYLISDAESEDADAHRFYSSNLIIQLVGVECWHSIGDENHQPFDVRSSLVASAEHFQTRHLDAASRVGVLAAIFDLVDGRQNFAFRSVVVEVEVDFSLVS